MNNHPAWAIKYVHNSKVNAVNIVDWETHHHIATIRDVYTHNDEKSDGAKAADLIVAAPELLKALKNLLEDVEYAQPKIKPGLIGNIQIRKAREAIAKAMGE